MPICILKIASIEVSVKMKGKFNMVSCSFATCFEYQDKGVELEVVDFHTPSYARKRKTSSPSCSTPYHCCMTSALTGYFFFFFFLFIIE